MLDLKVKAAALGIRSADFPGTPIEDIILGWEGEKLRLCHQARPVVDAQLAKLSPVSLAKSESEPDSDDEKKYGKRGREILKRITDEAHFKIMPMHLQAAWVREHGSWPWEQGESYPVEGLSKTLARDIIALGESGRVADSDGYWRAFRVIRGRLRKTAEG